IVAPPKPEQQSDVYVSRAVGGNDDGTPPQTRSKRVKAYQPPECLKEPAPCFRIEHSGAMNLPAVLVLLAATILAPVASAQVTIPIQRKPSTMKNANRQVLVMSHIMNKYAQSGSPLDTPAARRRRRRANGAALMNANNLLYGCPVTLGSGQAFKLDLDTGSSDTWFRGPTCQSQDGSCTGTKVNLQDPTLASQGVKTTVTYGSGAVALNIYSAPVTVGGASANMLVGVSTQEVGFADNGVSDGLMGLAFNRISQIAKAAGAATGPAASYFDQLGLAANQQMFSFYLSNAQQGDQGEFTVGGMDPAKFVGTPNCNKLTHNTFWQFSLANGFFSVNGQTGALAAGAVTDAIADTGTSLMILPTAVAAAINKALGATNAGDGTFSIPCSAANTAPAVNIAFGGVMYTIPPSFMVIDGGGGACFSGIAGGAEAAGVSILGDTFLRAFYSIYDKANSQVCFAVANHPQA
ncbi:hypothetical protein HK101_004416, partial [Irineochytrium annulatum]